MSTPRQNPREAEHRHSNDPVFVVGGGPVGRDVADRLTADGQTVTFVDRSPPTDPPPEQSVHGVEEVCSAVLRDLELGDVTTALVLEPEDATNLLLAQCLRTQFDVERVIVRVNDPDRLDVFENVDVETVDATAVLGTEIVRRR
ncbi:NAD-binding protein [Halobacterium wangiae]|uniref:NAD-binding protein n=1 Tax=Halobacterium wangiae TaxID=2902623 RepID=UPI0022B7A2D1|nr:NAD-binding protein [Halobacterium wangiae]